MSHGEGWGFLLLGVYLERAQLIARLLDVCFGDKSTAPGPATIWPRWRSCAWPARWSPTCASTPPTSSRASSWNSCCSTRSFRARSASPPLRIEEHLTKLARHAEATGRAGPERLAGRLSARLEFADMDEARPQRHPRRGGGGMLAHPPGHLRDLRGLSPRTETAGLTCPRNPPPDPVRTIPSRCTTASWSSGASRRRARSQRLISFSLEVEPATQLFSYVDAYGNAVYHCDHPPRPRAAGDRGQGRGRDHRGAGPARRPGHVRVGPAERRVRPGRLLRLPASARVRHADAGAPAFIKTTPWTSSGGWIR